ncbi:hypothetical protein GCM10009809_33710 [Isoptericola hypogeus]|uniref:Uncharacterized protein n=1 Tax=Isoptericola hypogeus TaxID=300179 RepID=A0ABN2JQN1_9MICO
MTGQSAARWRPLRLPLRRSRRPFPPVDLTLGRWVPGWLLNAAAAVAVPALVLLAAGRTGLPTTPAVLLALALAAWAAARPGPGPGHTAVAAAAVILLGSTAAPFDPAALWLAPLGYAAVRLGWWAAHVGPRTRVELAALRRAGARDLVVAGTGAALGLGAWALAGRPVEGLLALGVAALAALAWFVVRRHDGE